MLVYNNLMISLRKMMDEYDRTVLDFQGTEEVKRRTYRIKRIIKKSNFLHK